MVDDEGNLSSTSMQETKNAIEKHKKWTRFAFPIWLYVAVTGVVVYKMISPYYG